MLYLFAPVNVSLINILCEISIFFNSPVCCLIKVILQKTGVTSSKRCFEPRIKA